MSFGNSIKKIAANIGVSWKFYKMTGGCKPSCSGAVLDTLINKNSSVLKEQLKAVSFLQNQKENLFLSFPKTDVAIRKSIIEPDQNVKIKLELPLGNSKDKALELPFHTEKEIKEPSGQVIIIKRASHMLVVRRRKMKIHKKKKHQRRFKIQIQTRRVKQILANDKKLEKNIQALFKDSAAFSAEKYVSEKLEEYNWVKPVIRVRGKLAPDWLIKKHLEDEEERKLFRERVAECINYKK